jgi:hypothetical protein
MEFLQIGRDARWSCFPNNNTHVLRLRIAAVGSHREHSAKTTRTQVYRGSAYPDEDEEKPERAVVHVPFSCPSSSHVSIMSDHVHHRVHVHVLCFVVHHHVHHHVCILSCSSSCLRLIMSIIMFMSYHVHHLVYVLSCPSSCLCSIVVFMCYHVDIHVHVLSWPYDHHHVHILMYIIMWHML